MKKKFEVRAIGHVRSSLKSTEDAPKQGREAGLVSDIVLLPEYAEAADGLARWKRLLVFTWMDRADRSVLKAAPRGFKSDGPMGVFATRSPHRPNPIGLCNVEIMEINGPVLTVRGLDSLDGTPVIDIKPFIREIDDAE